MAYEIIFETGSLKGKNWRLPEGGMLTIGRSHSCGIRPKEPDVSGKHAVLREEGGVVWLEVLSAHKTSIDGIRLPVGNKVAITEVSQVVLGGSLAFHLAKMASAGDETSEIMPSDTATLGTGTVATVATRAMSANTATLGDETGTLSGTVATAATRAFQPNTATLGDDTGTLDGTGTVATVATRAMPANTATLGDDTGTLATSATRAADIREDSETSILPSGEILGAKGGVAGETTNLNSDGGETQMLATQMASREELEKLKAAYEQKKTRKTAKKTIVFGIVVAIAAGVSIWLSSREPEKTLNMAENRSSTRLIPALLSGQKSNVEGFVGISLPKAGSKTIKNGGGVFEAVVPVGKKGDVLINVVFEVFADQSALQESRDQTFDRYLENSEAMLPALDEMAPLPDEDFFGGRNGLRRGIPCSRREYWCGRKGKSVYGVISFFRCGTLCFAFRREVAAYERARTLNLMQQTSKWLYADEAGDFAARQWEGADGAGASSPAAEIARCEERLRVDSTSDWPTIEAGLRNVLVSVDGKAADAALRDRALGLLGELRKAKALHWQKLTARRSPLPEKTTGMSSAMASEVGEIDAIVRKDFSDPSEEWYFLARRKGWWK